MDKGVYIEGTAELEGMGGSSGARLRSSVRRCWRRSFSILSSKNVFNLGKYLVS